MRPLISDTVDARAAAPAPWLSDLRARGLDVNHRPIEMLDAYRPGPWTPPAYHALHHVHPDAHFSAYTKAVDWLVRGAAQLRGRRFVLHRAGGEFGVALAAELRRQGVSDLAEVDAIDEPVLASADVLVLCDPSMQEAPATPGQRPRWACSRASVLAVSTTSARPIWTG